MGIFSSNPPNTETVTVNMISLFDPKRKQIVGSTSLSLHEATYNVNQTLSDDHTNDLHLVASDLYHLPYQLEPSLPILDYLSENFSSNESIMEIMSMNEYIWEDHHHRSSFLPNTCLVDHDFASLFTTDIVKTPQTIVLLQNVESEGNLCNITETNPIDISAKPSTLEHIHVEQNY